MSGTVKTRVDVVVELSWTDTRPTEFHAEYEGDVHDAVVSAIVRAVHDWAGSHGIIERTLPRSEGEMPKETDA